MRTIITSQTDSLTIGALSRLTGVHIETIRYYERVKILPKPPRTVGGRQELRSDTRAHAGICPAVTRVGFFP